MNSQERVPKIDKVILTTKSRVIHAQISIPKQYQMMMSPVARVRFIKSSVIFRYHTKGVSKQVSSNSYEMKSYSCSNSKSRKVLKIANRGKRDYK